MAAEHFIAGGFIQCIDGELQAEAILAANPQLVAAEPAADATPDSQPDPAYRLSEEGLATLRREMRLRFDGQTDWSLIS